MKILFDECVPWPLAKSLIGHECESVQRCGWNGIRNGELLVLADGRFDLFVTTDQGIPYQQNLTNRRIAILQLTTNKLDWLIASAETIAEVVGAMVPGQFRTLTIPYSSQGRDKA